MMIAIDYSFGPGERHAQPFVPQAKARRADASGAKALTFEEVMRRTLARNS